MILILVQMKPFLKIHIYFYSALYNRVCFKDKRSENTAVIIQYSGASLSSNTSLSADSRAPRDRKCCDLDRKCWPQLCVIYHSRSLSHFTTDCGSASHFHAVKVAHMYVCSAVGERFAAGSTYIVNNTQQMCIPSYRAETEHIEQSWCDFLSFSPSRRYR